MGPAGKLASQREAYNRWPDLSLSGDDLDAESRLEWLGRQPSGYKPQPYKTAAGVLRNMGREDDAKEILIAEEDLRWRETIARSRGPWKLWNYVAALGLRYLLAYGYRPFRALWGTLAVFIIGSAIFYASCNTGVITPTEKDAYEFFVKHNDQAPPYYPSFSAFAYSLETTLPLVNLGQKDHWEPDAQRRWGSLVQFYLWAQILLGWFFAAMFGAGISGLVHED